MRKKNEIIYIKIAINYSYVNVNRKANENYCNYCNLKVK